MDSQIHHMHLKLPAGTDRFRGAVQPSEAVGPHAWAALGVMHLKLNWTSTGLRSQGLRVRIPRGAPFQASERLEPHEVRFPACRQDVYEVQVEERRVVSPEVAGSIPVIHPIYGYVV